MKSKNIQVKIKEQILKMRLLDLENSKKPWTLLELDKKG
jgi:hypothetical protein